MRIASKLTREHPRDLDYVLAANSVAALVLVSMDRALEADEFISLALSALCDLVDYVVDGKKSLMEGCYLARKA